jgi:adenylyltransferase/sulfurtransferase
MMTGIPEITPREVKKLMDEKQPFVLIDVREPHEFQICRIPGSTLIPLGEVPKRLHELDSAQEIVVHCRSGQRSARAVELLIKAGFRKIHNLKGGILAWSDQVDPSVPKY